jgi:hypothetical protein
MNPTDTYWTFQTAIQHAGGFYRRLAEAGLLADPVNRAKIFEAWPDMIRVYGPDTLLHRQLRTR